MYCSLHDSDGGMSMLYLLVFLYRQKNRQTDRRKTDIQADRQVNKLKHFLIFVGGGGRGCGYGVDGRKVYLGRQKGR